MSITSKYLWEKYPEARTDLNPDVEFEVDFAIIAGILKEKGKVLKVEQVEDVDKLVLKPSDKDKLALAFIKGEGWYFVEQGEVRKALRERFW